MKRVFIASAVVLVACSSTPAPAPIIVADTPAPSASPAPPPPRPEIAEPEQKDASVSDAGDECDQDGVPPFDCARLNLGQCSAAEYYACPRKSGFLEGKGFRRGTAARIGKCLADPKFKADDTCFKATESCVRDAVRATCIDPSTVATCEKELATCDQELKTLCAKFLSSLEPTTRKTALDDLRSQRKMRGNAKTCSFSWDLNGFPFCPFCPFR